MCRHSEVPILDLTRAQSNTLVDQKSSLPLIPNPPFPAQNPGGWLTRGGVRLMIMCALLLRQAVP